MSVHRDQLLAACESLLTPERFKDHGPNGLQVEGKPEIHKLVSGVTASKALIEAAIEGQADAILVHHGLFWRGQAGTVTGWMKQRLRLLLAHDISLLAYHLPLDAHPEWGNNAQLGQRLGWRIESHFGDQLLGCLGQAVDNHVWPDAQSLAAHLHKALGRAPIWVGPTEGARPIQTVAWCSGGAQSYFESAIAAGADAFVTGEISEPQAHLSRETGVAFFACGHHATERYGAPAVAEHVASRLGLSHVFIDIDNPA
ncbi:MAG: Nif3-like dinuclear metal center hexameric protein [Betaproteobacteria bacterium]|nr:Nif3-like dinuclear metal center hexameric protein [Betaproteobacteria bacterium]NBY04478.1 Nif3-like dinuclear metal center hexameric protein [Betaproteobacteria bacterium]